MGNKGGSRHQKRIAVKSIKIPKKSATWVVKGDGLPLLIAIRDYLGLAHTAREAEKIIKEGNILVDGKIERNEKRGLKLMNILEIKKINKAYLVSLDQKQRFYLEEIDLSKAKEKLCKIVNKTTLKKGKIQLNFHDGTNHILDKNAYSCGDVVKMKIPENEIIDVFELKKGNIAKILGGNHAGKIGTIERIIPGTMTREKMIEISDGKNKFLCPEKYVFVIGKGDGDDKNR